jgi:hypothetical protein
MRPSITAFLKTLAFVMMATLATPVSAQSAKLEAVEVRLFMRNTGEFSKDVLQMKDFGAWNNRANGSDFAENSEFSDFLIRLVFSSPGGYQSQQAIVRVTDGKKVLQTRSITVNGSGEEPARQYFGVYYTGLQADPLTIEVVFAGRVFKKQISLYAGGE